MVLKSPQISQSAVIRRDDICIYVGPANRARLEAIIADRNSSSKAVWRARIVLATADGLGINAIMKREVAPPQLWQTNEDFGGSAMAGSRLIRVAGARRRKPNDHE